MSTTKLCISLLLVLSIFLGVLAPAVQAVPVEEAATVSTNNVTIEGAKDFFKPVGIYDGHTYTLFDGPASSWAEAKEYCESLGGHLATITSAEENAFLYNYMRNCGYSNAYWGLTDQAVLWKGKAYYHLTFSLASTNHFPSPSS